MSAATHINDTNLGRRRQDRSEHPLAISVAGRQFQALDWNEHGFRISVTLTELPVNESFPVTVSIPHEGMDVTFKTRARPIWTAANPSGSGFEFAGLEPSKLKFLEEFCDSSLTRKAPNLVGAFEGLSVPEGNKVGAPVVALPDPTPEPAKAETPKPVETESLPQRSLLITLVYFGLGLLLTWFIGSSLLSHFLRLNVDSAILSRPVERIVAPLNGSVESVLVKEGDTVAAGQVIMQIDSLEGERDIAMAEEERNNAIMKLAKADAALKASHKSIGVYKALTQDKLEAAQNKVANAATSLRLAKSELESAKLLRAKNVISTLELDTAATQHNKAKGLYDEARAQLSSVRLIKEQTASGTYYSAQRKEIDVNELQAERDVAAKRVELAEAKLQRITDNSLYTLKAPYDAHVVTLQKSPGNAVVSAENIMVLEKDTIPVVEAFVSHDELSKIRMNSVAKVYVPTLDKSFTAKVVAVDPTVRFTQEDTFRLTWQESDSGTASAKSSRVTLEIPGSAQLRSDFGGLAGLPVEVSFKRAGGLF